MWAYLGLFFPPPTERWQWSTDIVGFQRRLSIRHDVRFRVQSRRKSCFLFWHTYTIATAPLHGSGGGVGRTIRDSLQSIKVHVGVFFGGARLNMAQHLANQN
jgi:hypothetical protein